jgi:hypothetical protein
MNINSSLFIIAPNKKQHKYISSVGGINWYIHMMKYNRATKKKKPPESTA